MASRLTRWILPAGIGVVILGGVAMIEVARHREELASAAIAARPAPEVVDGGSASNILPEDYVGPGACKDCHTERFEQWEQHPHSKMNRNADDTTVKGDFRGARLTLPSGDVVFAREGPSYTMTLLRAGETVRRYVVTRTVGSRFMQFYIGKQIEGPEPKTDPLYSVEGKLPFAYWFRLGRWLPQSYFDPFGLELLPDGRPRHDPFDRPVVLPYAKNCMLCHNTYPYLYRLGIQSNAGFPVADLHMTRSDVKAALDRSLPPGGRGGIDPLGRLGPEHLVTLGVSCESCHFGGKSHAAGGATSAFMPVGRFFAVQPRDGSRTIESSATNAYAIDGICNQCHSAVADVFPNGAGASNSREALDMLAGACTSRIKCNDCHDPHKASGAEAQPVSPSHLAACTGCHEKYADAEAAQRHARHGPETATCLDCHMPRISQGLNEAVRSHRISSPTDPKMFAARSANACNVCHLDRTFAWTRDELARSWGKELPMPPPATVEAPVGREWLASSNPHLRFVATQAYARSPLGRAALPDLIWALEDEMAVNRVFASFAVEKITGRPLPISDFDPTAAKPVRASQIAALLARYAKKP